MGLVRKATSISTGGMVHYRTPNERTAHYTKKMYKLEKQQVRAQSGDDTADWVKGLTLLIALVAVLAKALWWLLVQVAHVVRWCYRKVTGRQPTASIALLKTTNDPSNQEQLVE